MVFAVTAFIVERTDDPASFRVIPRRWFASVKTTC